MRLTVTPPASMTDGIDRRTLLGRSLAAGLAGSVPGLAASAVLPPVPSNPKASAQIRKLYSYLWSIYGKNTLTGQQEQNFTDDGPRTELDYIERVTGELPVLLGLDYIEPCDEEGVNQRAAEWHDMGGLVTICWHWGAPDIGTGYENSKKDFDVAAALRPGTRQNSLMLDQMDHVADLLGRLQDRAVPVLWRPFHEFSGDWFWWGKHGPEAFKDLWSLMYERYTAKHGLDHLLWVLGWAGQNVDPAYWPGRDRVDIAGADIYADDHGPLSLMFQQVKAIVGDQVPICLHENGPVPDPSLLGPESDWLWFMTWHTRWLKEQTSPKRLKAYYSHSRYLTLAEVQGRRQ